MELNILDQNVVRLIIADINSQQNLERKRNEWIAYQSTQGMLKDYVTGRLQVLFPKNYRKMRVSDISVSKKVNDKLSNAYCENPIRSINEAEDDQNEELHLLYKKGKFNITFQDFDEIFNLHRHGLFWVDYDYNTKNFKPSALRPFEYDLVRDPNNGEVLCVILNYPDQDVTKRSLFATAQNQVSTSDGSNQLIMESQYDSGTESKVYALWTKKNHVVVVVQKKEIKNSQGGTDVNFAVTYVQIPGNPNNLNPLGVIPFSYKQNTSTADYPTFNPITEQTINFNVLWTDLMTAATMQGFGQAIYSYPGDAEVKEQEIGYFTAIKLPQSLEQGAPKTEFKFENANPDLNGQSKTYLTYLKQVLSEHGITSNQSIAGDVEQFASGLDRMIANADVNKIIQKNQNIYTDLENDVFDIIKAWHRLLGINTFLDAEDINVYYPRPTVQINESEVIKNVIELLNAGLLTKKKALIKLNPNLTEDAAEAELEEISKEKQNLLSQFENNNPNETQNDNQNNTQNNLEDMPTDNQYQQ